jgi:processive 1,2-diacylglycerol beta-glucosyltransferase
MPKRILILSASVGAGHTRAAQAVELAVRQLDPTAAVRNLDVLELTNRAFRAVYSKLYFQLANKSPHVLGYFYDLMDRPGGPDDFSARLRLLLQKLNLSALLDLLKSDPADVVVNTHFLPAEIIASLRKKKKFNAPQLTVTTDFEVHRLWLNQPTDHYFTATDEGAACLQGWGVPAGDITVAGIPIHPVFAQENDRDKCLARHNLKGDRPIVLQSAGGFGIGPIAKIFDAVLAVQTPLEVVAVCGKNADAKAQLEKVKVPARHRVQVLGFTDKMDELMTCADVVVGKPGGLTTSEALACGAAMAIVNPIPGQESRNSDFLLENGAAIKINNVSTLPYKLGSLLEDGDRLAALQGAAARLGRPRAAFAVAEKALNWKG